MVYCFFVDITFARFLLDFEEPGQSRIRISLGILLFTPPIYLCIGGFSFLAIARVYGLLDNPCAVFYRRVSKVSWIGYNLIYLDYVVRVYLLVFQRFPHNSFYQISFLKGKCKS